MNNSTFEIYFKRAKQLDVMAECYVPRKGVACYTTDTGKEVHILWFGVDGVPYFENDDCDVIAENWNEVIVRDRVVINRP